jgi:hypothetical protein
MSASQITRRSALTALAGMLAAPTLAHALGGPAATRFRAIVVDVGPMRAKGDMITADWIAQDLPGLLRKSFAANLAPGDRNAPVLLARVDLVTLGIPGSGGGGIFAGNTAIDYIQGAGIVGGRGGAVYPLLSSLQSYPQMPDPTGFQGRQRVDNLAASFAQWLPGQMGLQNAG